jgi:Uma2 family endonuclease
MEQAVDENRRYTLEEYFRIADESVNVKYEFRDGEIVAMAGGTEAHSLIMVNVITELSKRLRNSPCRVYESNLRLRAAKDVRYTYPDIFVVCGKSEFDPADKKRVTITNAKLIVEVLSESTELSDRGEKFQRYILLPTLEEYVLVTQDSHRVETFLRQPDGGWLFSYFVGPDSVSRLRSLNIELPLSELYRNVEFPLPGPRDPQES